MPFRFKTYYPGKSPVHRCDPRVKIALLAALSVCAFLVGTIAGMGVLALSVSCCALASSIPPKALVAPLVPVGVLGAFALWFSAVNGAGAEAGAVVALRMLVLVEASMVVALSTASSQIMGAIAQMMAPLRSARVPVDDIVVTLALALAFIPAIAAEISRVRCAHASRGAETATGLRATLARWGSVFSSVFVGLFGHADSLARAMDARAYGAAGERTSLNALKARPCDAAALFLGLAAMAVVGFYSLRG